jgi:hypothetical protein
MSEDLGELRPFGQLAGRKRDMRMRGAKILETLGLDQVEGNDAVAARSQSLDYRSADEAATPCDQNGGHGASPKAVR